MEISHNNSTNHLASTNNAIESGGAHVSRRTVWMASFAIFSAALFVVSPGILSAFTLAALLSLLNGVLATKTFESNVAHSSQIGTLAGAMLASTLLWLSALAGSAVAEMLDLTTGVAVVTSGISMAVYAGMIIGESVLLGAILFILSRNHDAATKVAWMLDQKFAGFFGEVQ